MERLGFKEKLLLKSGFERPNLSYIVRQVEDKYSQILNVCNGVPGTGIVYARNRRKCEELSAFLMAQGVFGIVLPCRAWWSGEGGASGCMEKRRGQGDGVHECFRHGNRQAGRALRGALRPSGESGGVFSGGWARRTRRKSAPSPCSFGTVSMCGGRSR